MPNGFKTFKFWYICPHFVKRTSELQRPQANIRISMVHVVLHEGKFFIHVINIRDIQYSSREASRVRAFCENN